MIISAVRTERPGFLCAVRRNNVMLTRCKKGMVIITNKIFIERSAERTLLGKLAQHWEARRLDEDIWIDWRDITSTDRDAKLPGFYVPDPSSASSTPKENALVAAKTRYVPGSVGPEPVYARIDDVKPDTEDDSRAVGLVEAFDEMTLTRRNTIPNRWPTPSGNAFSWQNSSSYASVPVSSTTLARQQRSPTFSSASSAGRWPTPSTRVSSSTKPPASATSSSSRSSSAFPALVGRGSQVKPAKVHGAWRNVSANVKSSGYSGW